MFGELLSAILHRHSKTKATDMEAHRELVLEISGNTVFPRSQFPLSFKVRWDIKDSEQVKYDLIYFLLISKRSHLFPLVGRDGLWTIPIVMTGPWCDTRRAFGRSLGGLRRCKRCGFDPWVRKIPWRKWQPTPVFLSGESHGQRSLEGYSPQG